MAVTAASVPVVPTQLGFLHPQVGWVHAAIYGLGGLAVLVQHRVSRRLGVLLFAVCVLPGPWLVVPAGERAQRALTSFTSAFYFCRMLQLGRGGGDGDGDGDGGGDGGGDGDGGGPGRPRRRPLWLNLAHTFGTFMDTRGGAWDGDGDGCSSVTPAEQTRALRQIGAALLQTAAVALLAPHTARWLRAATALTLAQATLAGGVSALVGLTAFGNMLRGVWLLAAGLRLPWLMRNPVAALSLREFWGWRWNGVVQRMLKSKAYDPLVRGAGWPKEAAAVVTFCASGAIHAYPVLVAHEFRWSASVWLALSYFLCQVVAMTLQSRVLGRRGGGGAAAAGLTSRLVRRVFTLASVLMPAPTLVLVMLCLSLHPDDPALDHIGRTARSAAFATTWAGLTLTAAVAVAVACEVAPVFGRNNSNKEKTG